MLLYFVEIFLKWLDESLYLYFEIVMNFENRNIFLFEKDEI